MPDGFECIWSKRLTNAMNSTITKNAMEKLFIPKSAIEKFTENDNEIDFEKPEQKNELKDKYDDMMKRIENLYDGENGIQ